jgi:hypothetical protein
VYFLARSSLPLKTSQKSQVLLLLSTTVFFRDRLLFSQSHHGLGRSGGVLQHEQLREPMENGMDERHIVKLCHNHNTSKAQTEL